MRALGSLGIALFLLELWLIWSLVKLMGPAYTSGEATLIVGIVPSLLIIFSAYQGLLLARSLRLSTPKPRVPLQAIAFMLASAGLGIAGLLLAAPSGAHVGPMIALWGLLLQFAGFFMARRLYAAKGAGPQ